MAGPEILSITRTTGVAGQVAYAAKVQYPSGAATVATFYGSEYGAPGPIVVDVGGMQEFVTDASRFGEKLNPSWVRRFFA